MLYLSKKQLEELVEHSKREFPNEACGILAGNQGDKKVEKIYQMTNVEANPQTFSVDSKEHFKVVKEMRNLELEMVGMYHSHPETEARPSAHDVESANYPEISYVIVSIMDKENPSIRSFKIIDGKISEEEVKIV